MTPGVCSLHEEERGKAVIYGPSSHQINSTTQVQQVHKCPRIMLTACKQVPQVFENFTWNSAQAKSGSPSQNSASSEEYSPIRGDPKAQARDPVRGDPAQAIHTRNLHVTLLHARNPIRSPTPTRASSTRIRSVDRSKHATRSVFLPRRLWCKVWPM